MKLFRWKRLKIRMKDLLSQQLPQALLAHLHHTLELTLFGTASHNWSKDVNHNVKCLLEAVHVEKVTTLRLNTCKFAANDTGPCLPMSQLMLRLQSLRKLELCSTHEVEHCGTWNNSNAPETLTQLSIYESNVSELFLRTILGSNPSLSALTVDHSETFSNDSLIELGKSRNLASLALSQLGNGDDSSSFDITPLGCLQKLETLELCFLKIKPGPLVELWEGLSNLTKLDLIDLNISNTAFSGISALLNLKDFVV